MLVTWTLNPAIRALIAVAIRDKHRAQFSLIPGITRPRPSLGERRPPAADYHSAVAFL